MAEWRGLRPQAIVTGILLVVGAAFVAFRGAEALGLDSAGAEGAQGYVERASGSADYGTTFVEAPGTGLAAVPLGLVNILFRPFPWEIRNVTSAFASLEMVLIWCVVCFRSRRTLRYIRLLAQSPLFVAGFAFVLAYAALLGMVVFNMGIITRQRVVILPLILLLVHFIPRAPRVTRRRAPAPELAPAAE